jgi:hypothetical protein
MRLQVKRHSFSFFDRYHADRARENLIELHRSWRLSRPAHQTSRQLLRFRCSQPIQLRLELIQLANELRNPSATSLGTLPSAVRRFSRRSRQSK